MGEYADQIINGECCALCMAQFVRKDDKETIYEHGYPVVCLYCYEPDLGYEKQHKKSTTDYE